MVSKMNKLDKALRAEGQFVAGLLDRWQDEWQYEDPQEYRDVLARRLDPLGKVTAFKLDRLRLTFTIRSTTHEAQVVARMVGSDIQISWVVNSL